MENSLPAYARINVHEARYHVDMVLRFSRQSVRPAHFGLLLSDVVYPATEQVFFRTGLHRCRWRYGSLLNQYTLKMEDHRRREIRPQVDSSQWGNVCLIDTGGAFFTNG